MPRVMLLPARQERRAKEFRPQKIRAEGFVRPLLVVGDKVIAVEHGQRFVVHDRDGKLGEAVGSTVTDVGLVAESSQVSLCTIDDANGHIYHVNTRDWTAGNLIHVQIFAYKE